MNLSIKLPVLAVLLAFHPFALGQQSALKEQSIVKLRNDLKDKELLPGEQVVIHGELATKLRSIGDKSWVGHQKQALKLDEANLADYRQFGRDLVSDNLYEEAVQFLNEAQLKYPDSIHFPRLLTISLRGLERYREAVKAFEACESIAVKTQPDFLDAQFYFSFGAAVERTKDLEKASKLFKKSIELIGRQNQEKEDKIFTALVYNYLGYMWLDNDMNIDEAGELVKTALDLDPESAAIMDSVGWFYFKKEQFKEAKERLLLSAELLEAEGDDPDPVILDHIAQAHYALEETVKAIEYMQQAVALDPDNKVLARRLKQFQNNDKPSE